MKKVLLAVLALIVGSGAVLLGGKNPASQPVFSHVEQMKEGVLRIGEYSFQTEFAITPEEKARGLMFRPELPPGHSMIFLNDNSRPMAVWMKNTFVPLDVLFFNAKHEISEIFEDLQPLDETPRRTANPVWGMVEVPAGTVQKYKIKVGDKISF